MAKPKGKKTCAIAKVLAEAKSGKCTPGTVRIEVLSEAKL
jgi:hypothetical protein